MRKRIRLTVLACATALALAVTALAAAAYEPAMGVFQANYKPGGGGSITIVVAQRPSDDPTARIVIYTAPGYALTLGQAPGTRVGTVIAHVQLLDTGSTNVFTLTGSVTADDPAKYPAATNPCTPGVAHEAVWTLNAALRGQPPNPVPVYVDHTVGGEAAFSSAKLTVCFRNPTLPPGDPRRPPGGLKFVDAAITTASGIFRNPGSAGTPLWRSIFTPYALGNPVPNAAGTREAEAVVPMPYSLTLRRSRARRGFYRLAGVLTRGGSHPAGVRVELWGRARGRRTFSRIGKAAITRRGGKFVFNRRLPKRTTVVFAERPPTSVPCATVVLAPCTAAIESNAISRLIRIAPRRRR